MDRFSKDLYHFPVTTGQDFWDTVYMKKFLVRKGNNAENDDFIGDCGLHSNSNDKGEAEPAKERIFPLIQILILTTI